MKYLALLVGVAIIYLVFVKQGPIASVTEAVAQTEITPAATTPSTAPATPAPVSGSGLRRPLDRTHAALDAVRARNGAGEF
jgi:hypothetical protein